MNPRRATLTTCSAAHVLHDGLADALYVLLPVLAHAFGLSYAQVGILRAANKSAMALFQLPAGLLAERIGASGLLGFGTLCAGLGFLALGQAGGYPMLLAALFVAGFGHAFQHPLASALVSAAWPDAGRRVALGTYNFFGDVGKVGVAALITLALFLGVDWRLQAAALGLVACVLAIAIPVLLRRTVPANAAPGPGSTRAGWGVRSPRGFAALCAIEVVDNATRSAFLTFVAFLMIAKGLSPATAALAVPLTIAGGMAGKLACGFLAERYGTVRTIVITESATAGGIVLLLYLPSATGLALLPLIGVALNGTSSALYGTIGDLVAPDRVGRAFGLFYTIGAACGVAAPILYGLVADRIGVWNTLLGVGLAALLALPAALALRSVLAPQAVANR